MKLTVISCPLISVMAPILKSDGGAQGKNAAAAEHVGRLAAGKTANAVTALEACEGVRICAEPVGHAEVLRRRLLGAGR